MKSKKKEPETKEPILTFLQLTREGKFAKIEESSLIYARVNEQREEFPEEEYLYSVT